MTLPEMPHQLLAAVVAAAILLASLRVLVGVWQGNATARPRAWHVVVLLLLQVASGALLYFTLAPPQRPVETGTMVVLTGGANISSTQVVSEFAVALPEATSVGNAERMPDLASALRRHPGTRRLRVVGAGLVARDRDAVAGRALAFDPAALPRGIVELWSPSTVQSGTDFVVRGRVHALASGTVELLDPSATRRDVSTLDADGHFSLHGFARSAGLATFRLRVRDGKKREIEVAHVPLRIVPGHSRRVLMLAGGPSPELKYLRRWVTDAGLDARVEIRLGGGMRIGDGTKFFDSKTLDGFDLVVLDERAWSALGASRYAALRDAVQRGLGVLIRLSGPVSGRAGTRLRALGFRIDNTGLTKTARLPSLSGRNTTAEPEDPESEITSNAGSTAAEKSLPALSRQPMRVEARDGTTLLRDAKGDSLATWSALGRGRIAVWNVSDTYHLVLTGHQDRHARLWSAAFTTLARADGAKHPTLVGAAVQDQRVVICDMSGGNNTVRSPSGTDTRLLPDPRSGPRACAGYWPSSTGWHWLSDDGSDGAPWPFHVGANDSLPGVRALALHEATAQLVSTEAAVATRMTRSPGPRWPWLLGWLLASGLLWWLERSRLGRP